MTKEEYEQLKKEIVRQMDVKSISEAMLKGDWAKVDPEIRNKYVEYAASRLEETMKNLH